MSLDSQLKASIAETKITTNLPSDVRLRYIRALYTFDIDGYTIVKFQWRFYKDPVKADFYGDDGTLVASPYGPSNTEYWLEECGAVINQLGDIEFAYKGRHHGFEGVSYTDKTSPDGSVSKDNILKVLPIKFSELLKSIMKSVKEAHKNNIEALKKGKPTESLVIKQNAWYSIYSKWLEENKAYKFMEFLVSISGLTPCKLTDVMGRYAFGADIQKRSMKLLSDGAKEDKIIFFIDLNTQQFNS